MAKKHRLAPVAGEMRAEKWKTPEARKTACAELCDYLARGFPLSFYPVMTEETLWRYMEKYPEDFPVEALECAWRTGAAADYAALRAAANGETPEVEEVYEHEGKKITVKRKVDARALAFIVGFRDRAPSPFTRFLQRQESKRLGVVEVRMIEGPGDDGDDD